MGLVYGYKVPYRPSSSRLFEAQLETTFSSKLHTGTHPLHVATGLHGQHTDDSIRFGERLGPLNTYRQRYSHGDRSAKRWSPTYNNLYLTQ